MAVYSVTRISRLVEMYSALHSALEQEQGEEQEIRRLRQKEQREQEVLRRQEEQVDRRVSDTLGRRFACPVCRRKSWRSIETFRVHKLSCTQVQSAVIIQCMKRRVSSLFLQWQPFHVNIITTRPRQSGPISEVLVLQFW